MPLQVYFPGGIPDSINRIVNPDAIHKKVLSGLAGLEKQWSILSDSADSILYGKRSWVVRLFRKDPTLSSDWLHHLLYSEDEWPALTKEQLLLLRLLKRLRQMGAVHKPVFPRDAHPTESQIKTSLVLMAGDMEPIAAKMNDQYQAMLDLLGKEIAPMCFSRLGEDCDVEEAALVANGDIWTMHQMSNFPNLSPKMSRTLSAFLDYAYNEA